MKKKLKYELIPSDGFSHIKITSGKFKGIVFKYGTVKPIIVDDHLNLDFTYTIIEDNKKFDIIEDKQFINMMGDILVDIINND